MFDMLEQHNAILIILLLQHIHLFPQMACLEETTVFEIFFDDNVCYGIKHKLDVLCVCGTGHVGVDFFDVSSQVQI